MELLDRYLKAVAKALPEAQREDIIRELSEDIRSEMEDKAGDLGRPLMAAEQEAVLKQRGNPLLLAARYRQAEGGFQQHPYDVLAATLHSAGSSDADFLANRATPDKES